MFSPRLSNFDQIKMLEYFEAFPAIYLGCEVSAYVTPMDLGLCCL
jgi:hypothetical protein